MEAIGPIAARHGLPVIEDGAQSIGARRKIDGTWRMSGELGSVGTLSFFPTKNLGAWGDAGLMVTQDDALAERLGRLRLHGGSRQYFHEEVGTNSRLDTLQAAVLLAKLPHLPAGTRRASRTRPATLRRSRATRTSAPHRSTRPTTTSFTNTPSRSRGAMSFRLISKSRGIGHAVYYPLALHLQPCFAHLGYQPREPSGD